MSVRVTYELHDNRILCTQHSDAQGAIRCEVELGWLCDRESGDVLRRATPLEHLAALRSPRWAVHVDGQGCTVVPFMLGPWESAGGAS